MSTNTTTSNEDLGDKAQLIALVNPIFVTRPYVSFLTGQAGLVTSLADLGAKINDGTATRNDYIDVVNDLAAIGTSGIAMTNLIGLTAVGLPWLIGIGVGLAVWDYVDARNYDLTDVYNDLTNDLTDMYNDITSKYNMLMDYWADISPFSDDGIPPNYPTPPTPPRRDPLVLDSDKDGFISTIKLQDSQTYFDITGDGIKEKVSWIGANDGILAYDKNGNGKIDGIDEVFGNFTTSGFEELRQLIDSNQDGVIDRKDELFSRLKVWHDANADGTSQADELVSLKDEGVTSINLNAITTNIELGGATLTEASKYTDSEGNKELAADVNLEYDARLTTIDVTTIPDYSVDLDTLTLPNLRGYGLFLNSFISYNINDELKQKAQELVANPASMGDGFDEFLEIWSGYTEYVNGVKEKFNITGDIGLGELDKKVWIIDKLFNENAKATPIENNFENEMKQYANSTVESAVSPNVTIAFQEDYYNNYYQKEILDRYEGAFALQAFYKFEGAHYDVNRAKYVVDDLEAFNTDVANYLNSADNSMEDKVYLAKVLNMQEGRFLGIDYTYTIEYQETYAPAGSSASASSSAVFVVSSENLTSDMRIYLSDGLLSGDVLNAIITNRLRTDAIASIIERIEDSELASLLSTTLHNNTQNTHVFETNTKFNDDNALVIGNDTSEHIELNGNNTTVYTGQGDDVVVANNIKNNTFMFLKGDGSDTIYDAGGYDKLIFGEGIDKDTLSFSMDNKDLIITINANDKLTIIDWTYKDNRIEEFVFNDGSKILPQDLSVQLFVTDSDDYIELSDSNDNVNALGGDDVVNALGGDDTVNGGAGNDTINAGNGNDTLTGGTGNDTLHGGSGNDTYIYNLGDGNDTILDSSGNDTLKFGSSITTDMLSSKIEGNDLVISVDGSASITVKNYTLSSNKLENITLNDGTQIDITSLQSATQSDDTLVYGDNAVTVDALGGNDTVTTGSANDTIVGGAGNDTLNSGSGDDTLTGGTGSDTLIGGLGDDTYIFNIGDGHDTIIDSYDYGYNNSSSKDAGNDTIVFGEGITKDDIDVTIVGSDIVVSINNNDSITIKNATNPNSAIENIKLSDGTLLSIQDLQSATEGNDTLVFGNSDVTLDALGGDDNITTGSGKDTIFGGSGSDTIQTNDGDDSLFGGLDNDTLISGRGNDTLTGGEGSDNLQGGLGNDTYVFNRGDGKDTITDSYSYGNAGNDTLKFGEGIAKDELIAVANGNDMIVAIKEDGVSFANLSDKITIKDWLNVNNRVENITLSDGSAVSFTEIQGATDEADYLTYGDEGVNVDALGGDDVVITGSGADIINAGEGNDTLFLPQLRGYGLIMDSFISYNTNDALKEKALKLQAEFMNHFTCKKQSWHVEMNNRDFKLEMEVA
jgi:Ca2+-binding RTX toxin-like protein